MPRNSCPAEPPLKPSCRLPVEDWEEKQNLTKEYDSEEEEVRLTYGTIDLAKEDKRIWLRTPYGKLCYAHNASQNDSFMERKSFGVTGFPRDSTAYNERRLINYLEGNIDFPLDMASDPVKLYIRHRKVYLIVLFLIFALNISCSIIGLINRQEEIRTITRVNRVHETRAFLNIFLDVAFGVDILIYLVLWILGLLSYWSNKSTMFNAHSVFWVLTIITVVFLSYIHQIFLLAFLARIAFYVYVRYVISLLHTILLMLPETV